MNENLNHLLDIVVGPFANFLHPDTRLYWVFILISLGLAIGVISITAGSAGKTPWQAIKEQLSGKIWWNVSAKADYKFYIINGMFYGLIFAPFVLASAEIGLWVETTAIDLFGPRGEPLMGPLSFRIAYTICFFCSL